MATTFVVGALLAFGRWASDDPIAMHFGHVAWKAFPAGWVLSIEYGVIVLMVVLVIRGDRVDALLSSKETLTWLGGIGLFTAALYHDPGRSSNVVWGGTDFAPSKSPRTVGYGPPRRPRLGRSQCDR